MTEILDEPAPAEFLKKSLSAIRRANCKLGQPWCATALAAEMKLTRVEFHKIVPTLAWTVEVKHGRNGTARFSRPGRIYLRATGLIDTPSGVQTVPLISRLSAEVDLRHTGPISIYAKARAKACAQAATLNSALNGTEIADYFTRLAKAEQRAAQK